jgi:hypothetical protein
MTEQPLWSERRGETFGLTEDGFGTLMQAALTRIKEEGLLDEAFGYDDGLGIQRRRYDQTAYLTMRFGDPWADELVKHPSFVKYESRGRVYDLIELMYRELVSAPVEVDGTLVTGNFDNEDGQLRLMEIVNPILARVDPPLELRDTGEIVEAVAEPFQRLVYQPLPEGVPKKEVSDRVDDAVRHYFRRDATTGDRRAAVKELIDALEFMRTDVKEHMLTKDEGALFQLANGFAIRHNKPRTRRDFDEPAWLAWTFYMYLASIRVEAARAGVAASRQEGLRPKN